MQRTDQNERLGWQNERRRAMLTIDLLMRLLKYKTFAKLYKLS
jgi:hypothetical protein